MAYTTFGFFLKPGDSVYVLKDHIRSIASSFRISLSLKSSDQTSHSMAMTVYGGTPVLHDDTHNLKGVLVFADQFFPCKK